MKGILWTMIILVLTLVFFFFLFSSFFTVLSETVRVSAAVNAEEVVGILNVIQTSPDTTQQRYFLPKADCKLNMSESHGLTTVNMTINVGTSQSRILNVMESGVKIVPKEIDCDKTKEKPVYFVKRNNVVEIFEQEVI